LYPSSPGNGLSLGYDYADVTINTTTDTWTLIYSPGTTLPGSPTTTPTTTPPNTTPPDTTTTPPGSPSNSGSDSGSDTGSPSTSASSSSSSTSGPTSASSTGGSSSDSGSPSDSSSTPSGSPVTATGTDGSPLPADPALTPGQSIELSASGFEPGEAVSATLHSKPVDLGSTPADASGAITFAFTVPTSLPAGAHTIVFAGASTTVRFPFTLDASPAAGGGLSNTGFDTQLYGGLALVLVVAGGLAVSVGRRRVPQLRGRHSR
jgi:hypothetical protein